MKDFRLRHRLHFCQAIFSVHQTVSEPLKRPRLRKRLAAKMSEKPPTFYVHSQANAIDCFLPILKPHLPHSNPLYNRLQAPHNIPSRHCLFAATFPPDSTTLPEIYTITFADRSRHEESQIWAFNPLITNPSSPGLSQNEEEILKTHLNSLVLFLKNIQIPEAPGWPFSPNLRFGCIHEYIATALIQAAEGKDAIANNRPWNAWSIFLAALTSTKRPPRLLPDGFEIGRVPEEQLGTVLETSSIKRQASTMLMLPNVGLLNKDGKLVAWGYIGIDGSFATLYVLPDYRGRGFASLVATELLGRLSRGQFSDLGFHGTSGWAHSDVYVGNKESEGVMKSLGGEALWVNYYLWVDSSKF